jgi:cytochrome c oxidase assembly protein subunit 11
VGFATYNIFPEDCNVYFSKIQCFCFNQQLINPKEELLLPIFFYLEPEINEDEMVRRVEEIRLTYTFTKSAKQDLARFAADEQRRVEDNKRKLNEIRAKKMSMSISEYVAHLEGEREREEAEEAEARSRKEREIK